MTTPKPNPRLLTLSLVLLGMLTLITLGGPLTVFFTLRGGRNPEWPPDRPVEWWAIGLVLGLGLVLTTSCVATALRARGRP